MKKDLLITAIDWQTALAAPRYAGGHEEVMRAIFGDRAEVIAEYTEDNYQGDCAFAYAFKDGGFCVITDSFGSCSGCDAWEDSSTDAARNMIGSLVSSARFFETLEECQEFCKTAAADAADYTMRAAQPLAAQLGARARKRNDAELADDAPAAPEKPADHSAKPIDARYRELTALPDSVIKACAAPCLDRHGAIWSILAAEYSKAETDAYFAQARQPGPAMTYHAVDQSAEHQWGAFLLKHAGYPDRTLAELHGMAVGAYMEAHDMEQVRSITANLKRATDIHANREAGR